MTNIYDWWSGFAHNMKPQMPTDKIGKLFAPICKERDGEKAIGYSWEINWSTIESTLIELAGRWCGRYGYACDIIAPINAIQKAIDERAIRSGTWLFGFTESGVKDTQDTLSLLLDRTDIFRALWRLDATVRESDGKIELEFFPVNRNISPQKIYNVLSEDDAYENWN